MAETSAGSVGAFPGTLPTTATSHLNDNAPGDFTTAETVEDTRVPSYPAAEARLTALCFDDLTTLTFKGYTLTCGVDGIAQNIVGSDAAQRSATTIVWAFNGADWTQIRTHALSQNTGVATFTGSVPTGTRRVAVVIASYISAGANTSGTPAYHRANASLSDFRLTEDCSPPPVPTLAGQALLIKNQPAHRLVVS